ncbi:uncharacterized protein K452DRAFT_310127 [Aplosporella prunicola CBS 121167]|uniref:Zn(2)-C6 fungal-type domain-containing protein n=1 Tax=Aplosporella prunicola CBS 121167 TaxID=1176127 RepID=A0A6A6BAW8_9PEZI|nr:uncharacterized protein K452DRAFT_310127 [Aplosporella prunicola CBS 121167]KAF2140385.1 hypothetical protein K452DRAFT_310127 [Aplosporella prunicola CBS 121167]
MLPIGRTPGDLSPPHQMSTQARVLPSLRTVLNSPLLDASPALPRAQPTRLPSLNNFDQKTHGYSAYDESRPSMAVASSMPAPAYPAYIAAPTPAPVPHASNGIQYGPPRPASSSSGTVSSDHHSPGAPGAAEANARRHGPDMSKASLQNASRYVGQQEVPGEGWCYVYDDGSYCKTTVDGEPVNPSWGLTKAGKPRKRLAQACLTCREKKIKCEPGYPTCAQCARARRNCRGGMSMHKPSPDAQRASTSEATAAPGKQRVEGLLTADAPRRPPASVSPSPDTLECVSNALRTETARKRQRRASSSNEGPGMLDAAAASGAGNLAAAPGPTVPPYVLNVDPYEVDPAHTRRLLDLYFTYINSTTYTVFPRDAFMRWATNERPKSTEDHLLLYAIMCMGNVFSTDARQDFVEPVLVNIVTSGLEERIGWFTLQVCLSQLLLALYHFARGKNGKAYAWCGLGLRALSALRYNTEKGVTWLADEEDPEFGFNPETLVECRRRIFWAGFLMDRFNGHAGGTLFMIGLEEIFVRLPCTNAAYEAGEPVEAPLLRDAGPDADPASPAWQNVGIMGQLAQVSAIWGDVWAFTTRTASSCAPLDIGAYEAFHARTTARLHHWRAALPPHLVFTTRNLDSAIAAGVGPAGSLVSLHAHFHATLIRLNRHAPHAHLPPHLLSRNIAHAVRAARDLLALAAPLAPAARVARLGPDVAMPPRFAFSTPFPGYAVMLATDVLAAVGPGPGMGLGTGTAALADVLGALEAGLALVDEIARFWASGRQQRRGVKARLRLLEEGVLGQGGGGGMGVPRGVGGLRWWRVDAAAVGASGAGASDGFGFGMGAGKHQHHHQNQTQSQNQAQWWWRVKTPLEGAFERADDVVYGASDGAVARGVLEAGGLGLGLV